MLDLPTLTTAVVLVFLPSWEGAVFEVARVWQLRLDLVHLGPAHPDWAEDAQAGGWWASSSWGVVSPSWVSTAFPTCLESAASRTGQGAPLSPDTSHGSPVIYSSGLLFFWQWGLLGQRPPHPLLVESHPCRPQLLRNP